MEGGKLDPRFNCTTSAELIITTKGQNREVLVVPVKYKSNVFYQLGKKKKKKRKADTRNYYKRHKANHRAL